MKRHRVGRSKRLSTKGLHPWDKEFVETVLPALQGKSNSEIRETREDFFRWKKRDARGRDPEDWSESV
jgi:broad specificity phosphatase PhoE